MQRILSMHSKQIMHHIRISRMEMPISMKNSKMIHIWTE